jgi:hydrogenase maturation protease
MDRIEILGLGNVLMGDDAFGPYVIKVLEAGWTFPPNVTVVDAGTPGLDLTVHMRERRCVIVADAVRAAGAPGEVKLYRKADILKVAPNLCVSPHEPGLREALMTLEFAGDSTEEVFLAGVIPDGIVYRVGLSDPVQAAVPSVVRAILDELERLGAPALPREACGVPDIWWEPAGDSEK